MSAERKKLLWISISACVFVLLVLAVGFVLLAPKKGSAQAPATIGNSAPPKAQDPQDYLSAPPTSPSLEQPKSQDGNVIVVYGDKPSIPSATASGEGTTSAPGSTASSPAQSSPAAEGAGLSDASAASDKAATAPAKSSTAAKAAASAGGAAQSGGTKKPLAAKQGATATAKAVAKSAPAKAEYWIQAGSFTSRGRADELKQGLADKGMASLIAVKEISGKNYYRVRIGPYSSEAEAKGWLDKIKTLEGCSAAFVSQVAKKTK